MSKRLRTLLICIAAAIVVGGAAAAVCLLPNGEDNPGTTTSTTQQQEIVILNKTTDQNGKTVSSPVRSLTVKNASGEYRLAPRSDGSLSVEEYADLPVDTLAITSICGNIADLKAVSTVQMTEGESAYGLDSPTATVTAVFHDDTTETIVFGSKTPYETGYYCRKQGDDTLYIVETSKAEQFQSDSLSFIGKSLITAPSVNGDDNEGTAQLLRLWLTGSSRSQAIEIKVDTQGAYPGLTKVSAYVMTAPFVRAVDGDVVSSMSSTMTSLTASGVAAVHPNEATLEKYGLSEPHSTAAFTLAVVKAAGEDDSEAAMTYYNDREHMILLGNQDENGDYYALVDGLDIVYLLSAQSVPWAEYQYIDLTSKLLFLRDIQTVSSVTVSENGQDTVYALAHFPEKENKDEQLTVTSGSKTYSTSEFRTLYQLMISIRRVADAEAGAQANGVPVLKLTLTFLDGSAPMSVALYPMTASRYLCVTDDGEMTAVSISKTEDFLKQLHNYQTGQPVTSPY